MFSYTILPSRAKSRLVREAPAQHPMPQPAGASNRTGPAERGAGISPPHAETRRTIPRESAVAVQEVGGS